MTLEMVPSGETSVRISRRFAAAPATVFRAHVEPSLMRRWILGPEGWQMTECRSDPRPGGSFLMAYTHEDGRGFTIEGAYDAVEPPALIVHSEVMTMPEGQTRTEVETRFAADGDGTRLELLLTYPAVALRDAILTAPMKEGMEASYARLDTLLKEDTA